MHNHETIFISLKKYICYSNNNTFYILFKCCFMFSFSSFNNFLHISILASQVTTPPTSKIVEKYKEYKQHEHGFKMVDFKKLMNMLVG